MRSGSRALLFATLLGITSSASFAQTPTGGRCAVSAVPVQVRSEGLTERLGEIQIACAGLIPGAALAGNLTVALPVPVTNKLASGNTTADAVIAADLGNGSVSLPAAALVNVNTMVFSGINVTVPASGRIGFRISNIRIAATQYTSNPTAIYAQLFLSGFALPLDQTQVIAAFAQRALYTSIYNRGAIPCVGSFAPETLSLPNLFAAGTFFFSSRVTEGFATAFLPKSAGEEYGTRFVLQFSGFPAGSRIFVPDYIAGSTAQTQTAGGDMGVAQSAGAWNPGSGTLLLGRVTGADSTGAGGTVLIPTGVGAIAFAGAGEVTLSSGSGSATFEVLDASPAASENAQIPVFLAIPAGVAPATAQYSLSFGPISNVQTASSTAPSLRFANLPAEDDCRLVGDCNAPYYPKLTVDANPIRFTAIAGGATFELPGYIRVVNDGGGLMPWTATIRYTDGSGWAFLDYSSGLNTASVRVTADPKGLAPGTYKASVFIDAGFRAGNGSVPVTLVVSPTPAPPAPLPPSPVQLPSVTITKVVNAATFEATPLVAGSLGTAMGTNLAGKSVAVTLDGQAAEVLYSSATQINFVVPAGLLGKSSASLVATVDGASSSPQTVTLAAAWPSIFKNGVLNQDNSVNTAQAAAAGGSVLQIYATGVAPGAIVSVHIGDRRDLIPMYAGPAPTVPGVQQINVALPEGLAGSSATLTVCAAMGSQPFCSAGYTVAVR